MNAHNLLIALCLSFLIIAFSACDSGSSGIPDIKDSSIRNPDPGTEILPHTPPDWTSPVETDPDDGNSGGNEGPNDQQPVPEPSTLVLVGSGIALITLCRKKKKKQEEL